jgi:membrane protein DedA with SNARE-associated domain/membrane-associated phospholipid phosphatase
MIGTVASHILALPGWVALLAVFAFPALESSAFVGFVFPGEIALILGGVIAFEGRVPLAAVVVAGILGAVIGDSIGYAIGRRYGRHLLDGTIGRFVKPDHLDRAETYLAERGGKAVFFGRFTAALRVMIPGLAGMSHMRYRTFLGFNLAGAVGWVTLCVVLGYLGGRSWRRVEHIASRMGLAAFGVLVLVMLAGFLLRRAGGARLGKLTTRLASSGPVRRGRTRFPRATARLVARLDRGRPTGLALTVAVVAAIVATLIFAGLSQDVVAHEEIALWDPGVHAWVLAHRTGILNAVFQAVTWLGASAVTVPSLVILGGLLARRRRSWAPLVDIAVVYGSAVLLHAVVGQLVDRPRPPTADWLVPASGWSYPSGHTAQAVAAWGILALLVAARAPRRTSALAVVAAALVAALVAASRVYLGVHWLTDVLGAAAMSAAVLGWWSVAHLSWFSPPEPALAAGPRPTPTAAPPQPVRSPGS